MKIIKVEIYKAADGWRIRGRAANGRIVIPFEQYTRKRDALRALKMVDGATLVIKA